MKKEISYFLSILLIFTFSVVSLFTLFKRYSGLTFEHFRETCKVIASSFFSTGAHYIGFILTAVVLAVTLGLFLKTLLSYIKTKRKLEVLLQKQIFSLPQKFKIILERNDIPKDLIIIVENNKDVSLTIDWFSPKIVVSTKILKDLTKKMRVVLEKEADRYVFEQHKTARHLNLALKTVSSQNHFKIYPNFSKRNDYKIKRFNLLISVAVILVGFFLFKFPGDTHTIQAMGNPNLSNCEDNLCSTHCPTDNLYQSSNITPAFQTIFASFNTIE